MEPEYYVKQIARIEKRLKNARADYMKEFWRDELAKMKAAQQTGAGDSATPSQHDAINFWETFFDELGLTLAPPSA